MFLYTQIVAWLDKLFPKNTVFNTDSFFPNVHINDIREATPDSCHCLLTDTVLLFAIRRVNEKLDPIKVHIKALGYASFSQLACNGEEDNLSLLENYQRAIEYRINAGLSFEHEQRYLKQTEQAINHIFQHLLTIKPASNK